MHCSIGSSATCTFDDYVGSNSIFDLDMFRKELFFFVLGLEMIMVTAALPKLLLPE